MPAASSIRVLVVDDQLTMRALVRSALQQIGFSDVSEAPDGEEGLKTLIAKGCQLVISDYNMPKMDGLQLLKAIREYKPLSRTPFIILTGNADRKVLEDGAKLGLNNYLTKPFTPDNLRRSLEAIVGRLH